MAAVNPKERASAAQMLVKYYNGVELSTQQSFTRNHYFQLFPP